MRRRDFISLIGGAAAWPLGAHAQQPAKLPTIGFLGPNTPELDSRRVGAFVQRLRELGPDRGSQCCDRVPLGRGTHRAPVRVRGRVRPAEGGCHCHIGNPTGHRSKEGNVGHPDRICGGGRSGWDRACREFGSASRQRDRLIASVARPGRQAARTFARNRSGPWPFGGLGQSRRSCRRPRVAAG